MALMPPDPADAEPALPPHPPRRFDAVVVWLVWVGMTAGAFALVVVFGRNVPHLDDWGVIPQLTGNEPITLGWLWSAHNEHRIPVPRLLMLAAFRLAGGDFRAGMFLDAGLLALLAAALVVAARAVRGKTSLADAFFPIALLNWGHSDNLLWFWQVGFVVATVIAGLLLALVVGRGAKLRSIDVILAGLLLLALPLSGANGLAFVPPLALWLAACGVRALLAGSPVERRTGAWMLAFVAAATSVVALYFTGYRASSMPTRPQGPAVLRTALEFLSCPLGQPYQPLWRVWAGAAVALTLFSAALCLRGLHLGGPEACRALGVLCFLAGVVSLAVGIAWGRSGFGEGMGFSRRYVTLAAPLACAVYFAALLYGRAAATAVQASLLLAAAFMAWPNTAQALVYARSLRDYKIGGLIADIDAGLPPFALADRYARYPRALAVPEHRAMMAEYMKLLKRARVGPLARMRDDPAYDVVPLDETTTYHVAKLRYVLRHPRHAHAVRIGYHYTPVAADADLRLYWKSPGSDMIHEIAEPVLQEPADKSLVLWIDQPLSELAIVPDTKPYRCEISRVDLLVPPAEAKSGSTH